MISSPSLGGRNPLDPSTQTNCCEETKPETHPLLTHRQSWCFWKWRDYISRLALFAENPERPGNNCFMYMKGGHKTSPGPRRGEKLRVYLSWWASSARMYRTGILMWPFLEKTISSKKFCPFGCYLHCISADKTWKISQIVSVAQLNETHAKWCQKMIPKEKAKELVQASLTSRFLNTSTTAPSSRSVSIGGHVTLPQTSGILCAWLRRVNSVH